MSSKVEQRLHCGVDQAGLSQTPGQLAGQAAGQQQDQSVRHAKQLLGLDSCQTEVDEYTAGGAAEQTQAGAEQHPGAGLGRCCQETGH